MDDLFMLPEPGAGGEDALLKALAAGYGTDAALFEGGRALQVEDCETTMVAAMREQQEDFKMMNTIKKSIASSTVHQYNVRDYIGDEDVGFISERGSAPDNFQNIRREFKQTKYIAKRGEVTEVLLATKTYDDALAEEKLAVTLSVLKTAEKACFHGDESVVPDQFDGIPTQIKKSNAAMRNIDDLRGQTIQTAGETIFSKMAGMIRDRGGQANKVFYPLIITQDIQELFRDRLRFGTDDYRTATVMRDYPTTFGTLAIAGEDAGPDLLFQPKKAVSPGGIVGLLPNPPATVTVSAAANPASKFLAADAGNYLYTVHAVNESGTSAGTSPAAAVAVAAGGAVTITVTPAAVNPGTGFIICRSAKGGSQVMEMIRIGRNAAGNTVYTDLNEDLPGTAEMLFITEKKIQPVVEFLQLHPLRMWMKEDPYRLVRPFIMALFGTPAVKIPHWCG